MIPLQHKEGIQVSLNALASIIMDDRYAIQSLLASHGKKSEQLLLDPVPPRLMLQARAQ